MSNFKSALDLYIKCYGENDSKTINVRSKLKMVEDKIQNKPENQNFKQHYSSLKQ